MNLNSPRVRWDVANLAPIVIAGGLRNLHAFFDGRKMEEGRRDLGFDTHILGYIVEASVGKFFDRYPSPKIGKLDTNTGDLTDVQCKAVNSRMKSLIVRQHDPENFRYILGYVGFDEIRNGQLIVELLGWMSGTEAKSAEYWREVDPSRGIHQAAYFVPVAKLRHVDSFYAP